MLDRRVLEQLIQHKGISRLKKAAMNVLVRLLEPEDIEHLRQQFYAIDTDKTGLIKPEELMNAMKRLNFDATANKIQDIINEVDYHDNKMINYSEFLAATISAQSFLTEDRLWILFKHFDVDDSGFITKENFEEVMTKLGQDVSKEEIDRAISAHDILQDG